MENSRSGENLSSLGADSAAPLINRRDLIRATLIAGTSAVLGPKLSFAQLVEGFTPAQRGEDFSKKLASPDWKPAFLDAHQNETLIALSEVIIPATDTPGAKEALVNRYLDLVLNAQTAVFQQEFAASLGFIDGESNRQFGSDFLALLAEDKNSLLRPLAYPSQTSFFQGENAPDPGRNHFERLKTLIAGAYYSSEIGERELGWDGSIAQGPFEGCRHSAAIHK